MSNTTDVSTLFNDLDGGVFAERLSAAVRDVALGVVTNSKKGKVTITLDIEQIGNSSQVQVKHQIKYVRPTAKGRAMEEATTSTPLHVGRGGALTLFPELQVDMFKVGEREGI